MIPHHSSPEPGHKPHQNVTNTSWPLADEQGPHARDIKDLPRPVPARARLVLEDDGQVIVDCQAVRQHGDHVCIYSGDDRLQVPYVWLRAQDVRPRDVAGTPPAAAAP